MDLIKDSKHILFSAQKELTDIASAFSFLNIFHLDEKLQRRRYKFDPYEKRTAKISFD